MDYILNQVKEKGIVKYIESYVEDLEITDNHKKCMKEINNIQYKTLGNISYKSYKNKNNYDIKVIYCLEIGFVPNFHIKKRLLIKKIKLNIDSRYYIGSDTYIFTYDYRYKRVDAIGDCEF